MLEIDGQIENFMTRCEINQLRPKTLLSYEQSLKIFFNYLYDTYKIETAEGVKEKHIIAYTRYLQKRGKYTVTGFQTREAYNHPENRQDYGKNISTTTINNYLRNIRVFFNYLYDSGDITINPMQKIKLIKNDRQPLTFISDANFLDLLKCLDRSKYSENRDYTIIQLLLDTGMRVGECLKIKIQEVDFAHDSIFLLSDNTKSGKSRSVFFSSEMHKTLKYWLKFQDRYKTTDYLFCTN